LYLSAKERYSDLGFIDYSIPGVFILQRRSNNRTQVYYNQSMLKLFGFSGDAHQASEFLPPEFWSHPEDREDFLANLRVRGIINNREVEFRRMDRTPFWGQLTANLQLRGEEEIIHGTLIDVSDKKKVETTLKDQSETLQLEIDNRTRQLKETQRVTIMGLSKITEQRDPETGAHIIRMAHYSKIIANELAKLDIYKIYIAPRYEEEIFISAPLHDIGKVGLDDYILKKKGKLTEEEFSIMKYHTIFGGDTLAEMERQLHFQSFLTLGKDIAYHHHQRWDGTGYPNYDPPTKKCTLGVEGHYPLKGLEIPLSARIVALADVYDALSSKRYYKDPIPHEKSKNIIISDSGKHFDPDVVEAFLRREKDFLEIQAAYQDESEIDDQS
jgi:response regulator RpfG family c-di-GMP phosphodiesterase